MPQNSFKLVLSAIFVAIHGVAFNALADNSGRDVSCSFKGSISNIDFKNLKSGYQNGTSPLKEATFTIDGKKILKTSKGGLVVGRSNAVIQDLKDTRPMASIDFENETGVNRLVIYYCSGDGNTVDAKLFFGKIDQEKAAKKDFSFDSTELIKGSCTATHLNEMFTSDCSVFK